VTVLSLAVGARLESHIVWFARVVRAIVYLAEAENMASCRELGGKLRIALGKAVDYLASSSLLDTLAFIFNKAEKETIDKLFGTELRYSIDYETIRAAVRDVCREYHDDKGAYGITLLLLLRMLCSLYQLDISEYGLFEECMDSLIERVASDPLYTSIVSERLLCSLTTARRIVEGFVKSWGEQG
jgi:hypothetical protein